MVNYSNSIIYKLCCKDTAVSDIYIGSTCNFRTRKYGHKNACCNQNGNKYNMTVYQFIRNNGGWLNWDMVQIETYEAKDKHHLHSRERYWIEELKPILNVQIPTRTQKRYQEEYRKYNKEKRASYNKANKDHIATQSRERYLKSKAEKALTLD